MSLGRSYIRKSLIAVCGLAIAGTLFLCGAEASTTGKNSTAAKSTSGTTTHHATSRRHKRSRKTASWRRGQQKIDPARAHEIQEALIREKYLHGSPTGVWDQTSQRAMEKFQADNGWQTKIIPDSRALIKLGLGPNHDHLLNPESAMTGPIPASTAASRPDAPSSSMAPSPSDPPTAQPQR